MSKELILPVDVIRTHRRPYGTDETEFAEVELPGNRYKVSLPVTGLGLDVKGKLVVTISVQEEIPPPF